MNLRMLEKNDVHWVGKIAFEIFHTGDVESFFKNENYKIIGIENVAFAIFQLVAGEAEIIYIAVREEFRRQGIGGKMLEYFIENFKPESIFLEVRESNINAQKMYEKYNFKNIGIRKGYYEGGEDALLMEWKIC